MGITLSDYVSGGYYVTKYAAKGVTYHSSELLPDKLLSASGCICKFIPDTWAFEKWRWSSPKERNKYTQLFGLSLDGLKALDSWVSPRFDKDIGYPNVCFSLETANLIVSQFVSMKEEVAIFGMGLHRSLIRRFCETAKAPSDPQRGESGVYRAIKREQPVEGDGDILGFELLVLPGKGMPLSDSWLCNLLDREVHEKLGIRPNRHGLIDTFTDASKCVEHISGGDIGAEPGLWLPWLIIRYPLPQPGPNPQNERL